MPITHCTVSVTAFECVTPPPVPVTIGIYVPTGVAVVVVKVKTDEPFASGLIVGLLKPAVTPGGSPLTDSVTLPPNGSVPTLESAIVYCADCPLVTVCVPGVIVPVKSTAPTSSVSVVECVSDPLLPVTVKL